MIWALVGAMFVDLAVTVYALTYIKEVVEANPLAQSTPIMFLLKATACLFFLYVGSKVGSIALYRRAVQLSILFYIIVIANNILRII